MNVLLLKSWLEEEGAALIGARIAAARQLDIRSFVLELGLEGAGRTLLLCSVLEEYPLLARLEPQQEQQLLPGADSGAGSDGEVQESNFVKALRFHLLGMKLLGILQEGFDRSVTFTFGKADQYGRETLRQLRMELVGRASNAYLLSATQVSRSEGAVISIFKRVRREQNRVRHVITGKPLPPPPPLGKFIAAESSEEELAAELANLGRPAAAEEDEGGVADAGANPLELLFTRRVAASDSRLWARIEKLLPVTYDLTTLYGFIDNLQRGNMTGELFGLGQDGASANSVALEQWLKARARRGNSTAGGSAVPQRQELAHRLDQLSERLEMALRSDEVETLALEMLSAADEQDKAGRASQWLTDWQSAQPDWAAQISLGGSVHENGQELLHFAQRLRRGVDKLRRVIDVTTQQLAMLEQARPAKAGAGGARKPAAQPGELSAADKTRLSKFGVKYLRLVSSEGLSILCGLSDTSNDGLLRIYGSARHLWLHVRDYPGSHVIILSNGREVPAQTLYEAAVVAAFHSQGRGEEDVDVSYLPIKNLRRPKGGKPGQVLKTAEKVISVRPDDYEMLKHELKPLEM